jgi:hypothetical protein
MIQLTTLLLTLFTAVAAQGATASVLTANQASQSMVSTTPMIVNVSASQNRLLVSASSTLENATISVQARVASYFTDLPQLVQIARCESNFRQVDEKGNLLRGIANPDDVGVMQINEHYHGESAKRLGYNIATVEGNMAFARHLYEVYGTEPWSASAKCWKAPATSTVTPK